MTPRVDATYVGIVLLSLVAGVLVRRASMRWLGGTPSPLSRLQRFVVFLGALIGGALGAKLPFVLADPEGAVSGAAWLSDGRTITWGLTFGYLGVEVAKRLALVRDKTGDSFAIPVAVSVGIGRLACFHSGCCYGTPTELPWGVDFGDGLLRHPNQLYEAAFHLSAAAALVFISRRGWLEQQRIKAYLIAYMLFRVGSETWRPEPVFALGMTFYQLSAIAFAALFAGLWVLDARAASRRVAEPDPALSGGERAET